MSPLQDGSPGIPDILPSFMSNGRNCRHVLHLSQKLFYSTFLSSFDGGPWCSFHSGSFQFQAEYICLSKNCWNMQQSKDSPAYLKQTELLVFSAFRSPENNTDTTRTSGWKNIPLKHQGDRFWRVIEINLMEREGNSSHMLKLTNRHMANIKHCWPLT